MSAGFISRINNCARMPPSVLFRRGFGQSPCVQNTFDSEDNILPSIEFVRHGRATEQATGIDVPERASIGRVERQQVSGNISSEKHTPCRGQDTGMPFPLLALSAPTDPAGLVIDCEQKRL